MNGLFALISKDATFFDCLSQKTEKGLRFLSRYDENPQNIIFISDKKTFLEPDNNPSACISMGISTFAQKQWASIDNYRIVLQGQLFNSKDIIRKFRVLQSDFEYVNDAQMALALFLQKGTKAFADFDGYWSLIITDLDNQKMYAARDAFGNCSLYYCQTDTQFGIASQTKPLFSVMDNAKRINNNAVVEYLLWGDIVKHKQDFFSDIHELKPSHFIEYSLKDNSYSELSYYTLTYKDCKGGYNEYEEPYYIDMVRKLVLDSVAANIANKENVAIGLSGGLDSSTILCCAKKINPDIRITAFTSTDLYDGGEAIWAEKIVKHTNAEWIKVPCSSQKILEQLDIVNKVQNVPIFTTSSVAQYMVMENICNQGFDISIDGQGGDELFGGYRTYFPPFLRSLRSQWMLKHWAIELLNLKNADIKQKEIGLLWLKNIAKKYYYDEKKLTLKTKSKELEFLNRQYVDAYFSQIPNSNSSKNVLNDYLFESYTSFLPHILRWGGHTATSFQMDCLMPFSNSKKLTEYVFSIPSTFKIHHGWSKYLLRKAMTGIVPDEVLCRKQKLGFYTPEKRWLHEIESEIKKQIELLDDIEQFIDKNALLKQWDNLYVSGNSQFQKFVFRYLSYLTWKNGLND